MGALGGRGEEEGEEGREGSERKEGPFDPEIRTPGRHAKRRQKERGGWR